LVAGYCNILSLIQLSAAGIQEELEICSIIGGLIISGSFLLRALLAWLALAVFAVVNGTVGLLLIQSWAGEYADHVYKTVLLLVFMYFVLLGFWKWTGLENWKSRAVGMGIFWLALTLCFELGFFHYAMGVPWERLVADYRFWEGRLWVAVLLAAPVFPYLSAKHCAKRGKSDII